jgi:hypothetical protein
MSETDPARTDDEDEPHVEVRARVVDPGALEGNPFDRKAPLGASLRATGTRGWAAAALAIAVLVLAFNLRPKDSPSPIATTSPDGVTHITASDPRSLRDQIVTDLRAAGAQANAYEQLGVTGIDADLPRVLTPELRAALDKHHVPAPANGTLQIQISAR